MILNKLIFLFRYLEPISKMGVLETAGDTPVLIDIDDRDDNKMRNMADNPPPAG